MEPQQCWHLLVLGAYSLKTGQTFDPTSPNISIVLWPAKRNATMLANVGIVKTSAHAPCNIFF